MMNLEHLPKITKEATLFVFVGLIIGATVVVMVMNLILGDPVTDYARCERAIPYALVIEAQSVEDAIMCKTVEVGEKTEIITWLDKRGVRLDRSRDER